MRFGVKEVVAFSTTGPCAFFAPVLTGLLFVVVTALSSPAVELFRYRDALDGCEFENVFETDEQSASKTISEQKAAEISADWVTTFYHVQVGAIESQEFRTVPIPHWRFCFSDTITQTNGCFLPFFCLTGNTQGKLRYDPISTNGPEAIAAFPRENTRIGARMRLVTGTTSWIYLHAISQIGQNRKFSAGRAFERAAGPSILSGNCHGQY